MDQEFINQHSESQFSLSKNKKLLPESISFAHRLQCAVCGVQCAVCGVQCAVCDVQCAECGVQCAVCGVQCVVCRVQCAVPFTVHSVCPKLRK